ncbi:MAG: VCBS domain-containing protein, partial [Pseudomonadota bacterium]
IALRGDPSNPALDRGSAPADLPLDAEGNERDVDLPGTDNGGTVDAGAVETQFEAPSLVVTTTADVVNNFDGETSLREALAYADLLTDADGGGFANATITFAAGVGEAFENGGTIVLGGSQLEIASDVTILGDVDGDGRGDVTLDADDLSRVLLVSGGTSTLDGLTITGGSLRFQDGGGVRIDAGAALTLSNSMVTDNSANRGGAIFNSGTATLINTTVASGSAAAEGGGIFNDGTAELTNTTLVGNYSAYNGGALLNNSSGTAVLTNTTVTGNTAVDQFGGGGVYNRNNATLTNTLVLGNSGREVEGIPIIDGGGNLIGGADASDVFASTVTLADGVTVGGELADNGGPVETVALKADASNPALDRGSAPAGLATDAKGNTRDIDAADVDNGGTVDAGAVEVQSILAPVAFDDVFALDEDTQIVGNVLVDNGAGADFDPDGQTLTVDSEQKQTAAGGDFIIGSDGSFTYSPAADSTITDSVTYTVRNEDGAVDTGTITFAINPVNDAPVSADGTATVDEDDTLAFDTDHFVFNDVDFGDTLRAVRIATLPLAGILELAGTAVGADQIIAAADIGQLAFTPDPNDNGTGYASFTFAVSDGQLESEVQTLSIDVTSVNDAPIPADDAFAGAEGVTISGNVLDDNGAGVDSDVEDNALIVQADTFTTINGGEVIINADGTFTYRPAAGFSGTDRFQYVVSDGTDSATGIVDLTVVAAEDVINGDLDGLVTEDGATDTVSGAVSITAELGALTSFDPVSYAPTGFGQFSFAEADGTWTYDLFNNEATVQALGEGETVVESYAVSSFGGLITETIDITIVGTDDPTEIVGDLFGTVNEDGQSRLGNGTTVANGSLSFVDIDDDISGLNFRAKTETTAGIGDFTIDQAGNWQFTLDNDSPQIQALGDFDSMQQLIEVESEDGSVSETITIAITGWNDTATISFEDGDDLGGFIFVSGPRRGPLLDNGRSGQLVVSDADDGEDMFQVVPSLPGDVGTFSYTEDGSWTFDLDENSQSVIDLADDEVLAQMYTMTSVDGTVSQEIEIIISRIVTTTTLVGRVNQSDLFDVFEGDVSVDIFNFEVGGSSGILDAIRLNYDGAIDFGYLDSNNDGLVTGSDAFVSDTSDGLELLVRDDVIFIDGVSTLYDNDFIFA